MASTANIQIHLTTIGDVVLDQVYNLRENPDSIATVITQQVGGNPGGGIVIANPFPNPGYVLGGLLIVPPRDNIYGWAMGYGPNWTPFVVYHPAAPSWFAWKDMPIQPEIAHMGPTNILLPFIFIWI